MFFLWTWLRISFSASARAIWRAIAGLGNRGTGGFRPGRPPSVLPVALAVALALWFLGRSVSPDAVASADVKPPAVQIQTKEPALAQAAEPVDVGGIYLSRTEDDDGVIHGAVTIMRHKDIYLCQWVMVGTFAKGVGIRTGDSLSVSWAMEGDKIRGVTVYRIEKDRLVGRWASLPGSGVMQRETLFWIKGLPAPKKKDE